LEHVVEFWSASLSRRRQGRLRRRAAWLAAALMVSVAGPWLAVAAAAGAWQWASYSNDGTRQLRQLTRSVIVWYGRNDKFRNVRTAGGFVINATELRSVNFSMQAVDVPLRFTPRRHGRCAQRH